MSYIKNIILVLPILLVAGCFNTPGKNAGGSADITRSSVEGFLSEYQLNSPGVAADVARTLRAGGKYRKRVKDQRGKFTTLTAWIDKKQQNVFCITFYRDEKCPDCNGTGQKKLPKLLDFDVKIAGVSRICPRCNGTGILKNHLSKRCWTLGGTDYATAEEARSASNRYVMKGAPSGADRYVKMLSSRVPTERLEACEWLDKNYIRAGMFFRDIMPILDRARYSGNVSEKSLTSMILGSKIGDSGVKVYQFWAGKGEKKLYRKAYYRIYIGNSDGKVLRTEFAADKSVLKNRRRR